VGHVPDSLSGLRLRGIDGYVPLPALRLWSHNELGEGDERDADCADCGSRFACGSGGVRAVFPIGKLSWMRANPCLGEAPRLQCFRWLD
jgi:hypothetical protein